MNIFASQLELIIDDYDSFSSLPMVIVTQGGVSFAVVSTLLNDLGIVNSELGRLALSTAFVNDLTGKIKSFSSWIKQLYQNKTQYTSTN